MTQKSIEFKGSLQAMTYLVINNLNLDSIKEEIKNSIKKAPGMFQNTPLVADFINIQTDIDASFFEALKDTLWSLQIYLIGIRNSTVQSSQTAHQLGIPTLTANNNSKPQKPTKTKENKPLIIKQNIRSGQQISTENKDVIVMGNLSPTAEIISTNSTHIHGTLAGKVIAGINNPNAIITCQCFQAELVSINGVYQLTEHFPEHIIGEPVCIQLVNDTLSFTLKRHTNTII